jgi:hypothetical protein
VFLYVLLVLRLQACRPTIYQSRKTRLYYFTEDGVFRLDPSGSFDPTDFQVSPSTWCLIDSNQELSTVPVFIQDLNLFIVQSSSPRQDRLEWTKKQSRETMDYFLKPWTLSELFVGYVICARFATAIDNVYSAEVYSARHALKESSRTFVVFTALQLAWRIVLPQTSTTTTQGWLKASVGSHMRPWIIWFDNPLA